MLPPLPVMVYVTSLAICWFKSKGSYVLRAELTSHQYKVRGSKTHSVQELWKLQAIRVEPASIATGISVASLNDGLLTPVNQAAAADLRTLKGGP